jgi:hypothetical protein
LKKIEKNYRHEVVFSSWEKMKPFGSAGFRSFCGSDRAIDYSFFGRPGFFAT